MIGGQLKQLIGQTLFAAAKESTRYAFNGVLVVAKGKKLELVSTDGRRLAMAKGSSCSDKLGKDGAKAIVPRRHSRSSTSSSTIPKKPSASRSARTRSSSTRATRR